MKQREQALLLLRKAGQDEALLDEVLASQSVDDEVIGFHCQQAAEKILKALLSDLGARFRKTHNIRSLMKLLADSGCPLPAEFAGLEEFTPFAVAYRYEDYEADSSLDRDQARLKLRTLRSWVEAKLQERRPGE
jgi:HEPN domain-containing protein